MKIYYYLQILMSLILTILNAFTINSKCICVISLIIVLLNVMSSGFISKMSKNRDLKLRSLLIMIYFVAMSNLFIFIFSEYLLIRLIYSIINVILLINAISIYSKNIGDNNDE